MIVQPPFVLADTSDRCIEDLFRFSGVFGISVPDNRRELLIIGPGYLEIQFYPSYTWNSAAYFRSKFRVLLLIAVIQNLRWLSGFKLTDLTRDKRQYLGREIKDSVSYRVHQDQAASRVAVRNPAGS
jgi:hypothetical protein